MNWPDLTPLISYLSISWDSSLSAIVGWCHELVFRMHIYRVAITNPTYWPSRSLSAGGFKQIFTCTLCGYANRSNSVSHWPMFSLSTQSPDWLTQPRDTVQYKALFSQWPNVRKWSGICRFNAVLRSLDVGNYTRIDGWGMGRLWTRLWGMRFVTDWALWEINRRRSTSIFPSWAWLWIKVLLILGEL